MRVLHILLRVFLGIFFIISAYLKLFPSEMLELSIAETGIFSYVQSVYVARLLIGFEMFLGVMLISGAYRKLTWIANIATLAIFSVYLIWLVIYMPGISDCGCMGLKIHISPMDSIYKNLALIVLCIGIWALESRFPAKWIGDKIPAKWILVFAIVVSFSLPFILNPASINREALLKNTPVLTTKNDLSEEAFLTWHSNDTLQITDGKKLVCYFSPVCRFCRMTARKIMVFLNETPEPFPVYFLFAGNPESREKLAPFYTETMSESIPTAIIEKDKFFSVSGPDLPVVFYMDGDSIIDRDNFRTLSEDRVLKFFELEK